MKFKARQIVISIALLIVLVVLYIKSYRIVPAEHQRFEADLSRISDIDSLIDRNVLEARLHTVESYDVISEHIESLKRASANLAADIPAFVSNETRRQIRQKMAVLSEFIRQKEELAAQFKSENAPLNNSPHSLPKVEALTRQILATPIRSSAEGIEQEYNARFTEAMRTADYLRAALYSLCAFLLLGIGYTIYALEAAKRNLEERVETRTRALREESIRHLRTAEERDRFFTASMSLICISSTDGRLQRVNPACLKLLGWGAEEVNGKPFMEFVHPEDRLATLQSLRQLTAGIAVTDFEMRCRAKDGRHRWIEWTSTAEDKDGLFYSCGRDITEERETQQALRLMQTSVEQSPDGVWWLDCDANFVYVNEAACSSVGFSRESLLKMKLSDIAVDLSVEDWSTLWNRKKLTGIQQGCHRAKDGRVFPVEITFGRIAVRDREFACVYTREITERKRAEMELEKVHKDLVETSRRAGMAEVATSVLHNVGNVLNSVNVSATLVAEKVRTSRASNIGRMAEMLEEHSSDLATFMASDTRGQQLPTYVRHLHQRLLNEKTTILSEVDSLLRNIEHIKEIVAMQQSYAKVSGVTEVLRLSDLADDSVRMNGAALTRHTVSVVREYEDCPPIALEKQKVLQILINLIRNAKYACDESGRSDKRLTIRTSHDGKMARIAIIDNGVGIPPENLTRIFGHGFTTRKDGHGFGLHSSALAAREMGGSLQVHSDGAGMGATFTLQLPMSAEQGLV